MQVRRGAAPGSEPEAPHAHEMRRAAGVRVRRHRHHYEAEVAMNDALVPVEIVTMDGVPAAPLSAPRLTACVCCCRARS